MMRLQLNRRISVCHFYLISSRIQPPLCLLSINRYCHNNEPPRKYYPKNPRSTSPFLTTFNEETPPVTYNKLNSKYHQQYTQSDIDNYFDSKHNVKNYRKHDVLSMMKAASNIRNSSALQVDKYFHKIAEYLQSSKEIYGSGDICNMIAGLRHDPSYSRDTEAIATQVAKLLNQSNFYFNKIHLSLALFGLRWLNSDSLSYRRLLKLLSFRVIECEESFDTQAVGNALFGLQNMSSDYEEVRMLILALVPGIESCKEGLNSQAVSNSIFGLQNLSSQHVCVRNLIRVLIPKIESCEEPCKAQAVGNIVYGLKNMNSEYEEVQQLIFAILPHIESCTEKLKLSSVVNAMYGLKDMNAEYNEVRYLMKAIVEKIQSCSYVSLSTEEICKALQGLQNKSSKYKDSNNLLTVFASKLYDTSTTTTTSSSSPSSLLSKATLQQKQQQQRLSMQSLANAMYGLYNKQAIPIELIAFLEKELLHILTVLKSSIETVKTKVNNNTSSSTAAVVVEIVTPTATEVVAAVDQIIALHPLDPLCLYQAVVLTSFFSQNATNLIIDTSDKNFTVDTSNSNTVNNNNNDALLASLSSSSSSYPFLSQFSEAGRQTLLELKEILFLYLQSPVMLKYLKSKGTSRLEVRQVRKIERNLKFNFAQLFETTTNASDGDQDKTGKEQIVEKNVLLHGFECDMIARVKDGQHIINYEIDNSSLYQQNNPGYILFCQLRDDYLKQVHGVIVKRSKLEGEEEEDETAGSNKNHHRD